MLYLCITSKGMIAYVRDDIDCHTKGGINQYLNYLLDNKHLSYIYQICRRLFANAFIGGVQAIFQRWLLSFRVSDRKNIVKPHSELFACDV